MKILYHMPSLDTIYAGRTIYHGYKNAFTDLSHTFETLTASDSFAEYIKKYQPDIFMTSLHPMFMRALDQDALRAARQRGMKVMVNIPFWHSPFSRLRVNEASSLKDNAEYVAIIKSDRYGDVYYNSVAQDDERMAGFAKGTGRQYLTVPLAADKIILAAGKKKAAFIADVAYIGTYLPEKRNFFKSQVFPLKRECNLRLYGQDWTFYDRMIGLISKAGQYYNIKKLSAIQKPKLQLTDEADIYASSIISINVHEDYQKQFGGDCNERTFKIPFCGGFEITDDVACIRSYLADGKEIVVAKDRDDWYDKIRYYLSHPVERQKIIDAGRNKVLRDHTYHNRVKQLIESVS